jgi:hypothetical protein
MNLLNARLLYDIKNNITLSEDSYLDAYDIDEEIRKYHYPLDIFPQNAYNDVYGTNFNATYTYLKTNCSWLWRNFYTEQEVEIIVIFLISIGAMAFDGYNYDAELVAAFQRLINTTTTKEEIQFCLDEFKYKLLMYYISHKLEPALVAQYFTELDAIEEEHNSMILFGEKIGNPVSAGYVAEP